MIQTLILNRYIIREISKPMAVICAVLVAIFASYSAAQYLAEAVRGLFPPGAILFMLLLRIIIALEVLLPAALCFSVVIALGRMYRDSEIIAMFSCGIGGLRILKSVLSFACIIAVLVAVLSIVVRPWAYKKVYGLKAQAENDFDLSRMEAGIFYEIESAHVVIFAGKVDHQHKRAQRVFIHKEENRKQQVIFANQVYQLAGPGTAGRLLVLKKGYVYEFASSRQSDKITQFDQATYLLSSSASGLLKYRRRSASIRHLADSHKLEDVAELHWRLSMPVTAILLALLAVPLSRTTPRQGKFLKLVPAVLIFTAYYNILVVVRDWVEKGVLHPIPGIWWVQAVMAGLVLVLLWKSGEVFGRRSVKKGGSQ